MSLTNLNDLQFTGSISSLDLSGLTIKNCRFDNVVWTNCKFDQNTVFLNCHFSGGTYLKCEHFGMAQFNDDCVFDKEADAAISHFRIVEQKKKINREDIQRDIELMIKKFVPRDGIFKLVKKLHISSGSVGLSPHKNVLVDLMKKHIIEMDPLHDDSYQIKTVARAAINNFYNNNRFAGELSLVLNDLCKELNVN